MNDGKQEPNRGESDAQAIALLRQWLSERRDTIAERAPGPEDHEAVRSQLAALASPPSLPTAPSPRRSPVALSSHLAAPAGLALWRILDTVMERGLDLFGEEPEAAVILAGIGSDNEGTGLETSAALELARGFLAPAGQLLMTPAALAARLRREPPARLELPDGVELAGVSLEAFLESAHFPFGQYRVGETRFFVTPSLRLGAALLEALARSGRGERRVGGELLVWQPASFRVAAGTTADAREARPFVAPSGTRAYLWLGPALPGGPLVIRDANGAETRIPVPDSGGQAVRQSGDQVVRSGGSDRSDRSVRSARTPEHPSTRTPEHLPVHPALRRAQEALGRGERREAVELCLREVMRSPGASGEALACAGRLWQALERAEVAHAAFTMALERGSAAGALGLSQLAEAMGEGLVAAARPLDAAIARNLRSAEVHARYAELLGRLPSGWDRGPLVEWHRRQAEALRSGMRDEE